MHIYTHWLVTLKNLLLIFGLDVWDDDSDVLLFGQVRRDQRRAELRPAGVGPRRRWDWWAGFSRSSLGTLALVVFSHAGSFRFYSSSLSFVTPRQTRWLFWIINRLNSVLEVDIKKRTCFGPNVSADAAVEVYFEDSRQRRAPAVFARLKISKDII